MKKYINTIILVVLVLLQIGWMVYSNIENEKTDQNVTNKITEMSNDIMLRMNNHALEIQGVKHIIDSSRTIDPEVSFMYAEEIVNTAHRYDNVSVPLLTSVLFNESTFDPNVCSKAGACGMGQLMPEIVYWIAKEWGMIYTDSLVFDYKFNIRATAWFLNFIYIVPKHSKGSLDGTIAYYNGGARQAYRWKLYKQDSLGVELDSLEITYKSKLSNETRNYVYKVLDKKALYTTYIRNELPINKEN